MFHAAAAVPSSVRIGLSAMVAYAGFGEAASVIEAVEAQATSGPVHVDTLHVEWGRAIGRHREGPRENYIPMRGKKMELVEDRGA